MRIIFVGGGNIAEAIFVRLSNYKIVVIQHNETKLTSLVTKYPQIDFQATLNFVTNDDDLIFLTVKPQNAKETCLSIKEQINPKSTVISVMAGVTTHLLTKWLNTSNIVRAMPNTPSLLGLGVSGIYFTPQVEQLKYQQIYNIFVKIGHAYVLDSEDALDRITSISGSAPAFVFYFIESMIYAAIDEFGFSEEASKEIVLQVMKGCVAMIEKQPDISINELRANVTSKNGTSEAGIKVFEKYNFNKIILEAEVAAYNRAHELGQTL